jgi:hypothetical protein
MRRHRDEPALGSVGKVQQKRLKQAVMAQW